MQLRLNISLIQRLLLIGDFLIVLISLAHILVLGFSVSLCHELDLAGQLLLLLLELFELVALINLLVYEVSEVIEMKILRQVLFQLNEGLFERFLVALHFFLISLHVWLLL